MMSRITVWECPVKRGTISTNPEQSHPGGNFCMTTVDRVLAVPVGVWRWPKAVKVVCRLAAYDVDLEIRCPC